MTASSIQVNVRDALQNAFSGLNASVYDSVPETVIPPAIVLVPSSPYFEVTMIGKSVVKLKVNLTITALVAYYSNAASLNNLEKLVISILAALPAGYVVDVVERPVVTQVGPSSLLVSDINVSTYYTQTS
jgi:hypothetical protein